MERIVVALGGNALLRHGDIAAYATLGTRIVP